MFSEMPAADYVAQVCEVQLDGRAMCPKSDEEPELYCGDNAVTVRWDASKRAVIPYRRAVGGIVRISLCDSARRLTDANGMALIVPSAGFQPMAARFGEARRVVRRLNSSEDDPTAEYMLRAFDSPAWPTLMA